VTTADEVQLALDGASRTLFLIVAVLGSLLFATEAAVRFALAASTYRSRSAVPC
jgi:hypothetical protein